MIVTVSRQFGAGGGEVAGLTAAALGFRVVDNELIDRVALRTGVPPEEVAEREEKAPGFIERLSRALSRSAPELFSPAPGRPPEPEEKTLVQVTERVVAEIAAEGRVVLVGRAASAVLSGAHDAIHVKLVAPVPARIERIIARFGVDAKEAERRLRETDANRARYHMHHYGRDWNDAAHYHMVLNTGVLGTEGAMELIVARAKRVWPAPNP
ncbi:MAG: cytidylate kinase-like family protein [Gemmatimonadales bacterium]|nr:cytidylate kinase-like family protein [Gemmatimonadales bacterium]